jgi:hypothetical protein
MKAFYEYHQDLFSMGYYFANSGESVVTWFCFGCSQSK